MEIRIPCKLRREVRKIARCLLDGGAVTSRTIRDIGERIGEDGEGERFVLALLERLIGQDVIYVAGDIYVARNFVGYSDFMGSYYWIDDPGLIKVYYRRGSRVLEDVCLDSEEDLYFYCHYSNAYYSSRDFDSVEVEGSTYCWEVVQDFVFQWSDGSYHWEPERNLGLVKYHQGFRPFWRPGKCLSFELEISVGYPDPEFGDCVRKVWDEAEEDSSLDPWGAELIVGYVPLEQIQEKIEKICQLLESFQCHVPDDLYAFHISASALGWGLTQTQIDKLGQTFYDQYDLVIEVARRKPNRYCQWQYGKINLSKGKNFALRKAGDRIEFRIFKSSVFAEDLLECVNLVHAFLEFSLSDEKDFDAFWRNWKAS